VVVFMLENQSYGRVIGPVGSTAYNRAPNINKLAAQCGLAANFWNATHPSHPNYMAVTGGDVYPVGAVVDRASIFGQVVAAGEEWRSYNESMPGNCVTKTVEPYKAGHNPGIWYRPLAADCRRWDVPFPDFSADIANDTLPAYAYVTPNQCNNMHASCDPDMTAVAAGDAWLGPWIEKLTAMPSYRAGRTVIFVTWDEGNGERTSPGMDCIASGRSASPSETCHIATLVISPYVTPGTVSRTFLSHYSLLKTSEQLLGIPNLLVHAGDAATASMRAPFGI
jgi:phosphatidylinositol-3-phosphatase